MNSYTNFWFTISRKHGNKRNALKQAWEWNDFHIWNTYQNCLNTVATTLAQEFLTWKTLLISYACLNLSLHILEDSWGDEESQALKVFVTKNPKPRIPSLISITYADPFKLQISCNWKAACVHSQSTVSPNSLWDILISMFSSTSKRFLCCNPNMRKAAIANFALGRFFANKS